MANPSANTEQYDPSTFWIAPARNFRSSARLHLQHALFQNTLGYFLESHVQASVAGLQQLKVADLACGNGVWLNDLDRELSAKGISAKLDGYDINSVNFPAPVFLPQSVTLTKLDVLARPIPEELIGAYDVVHVRAFSSIAAISGVAPPLSTALALLKPGGWLQWEESRGGTDTFIVESPSPETPKTACDTIVRILKAGADARGLKPEVLFELDQHMKEHGFQEVHLQMADIEKRDLKAWTEDYLMVWEELYAFFPPKAQQPQAPLTRESWLELFEKAVAETEQGVVVYQSNIQTVVGQKPL